jgi:hypothetical protein
MAASSAESVSFSFIHSKDVPVSACHFPVIPGHAPEPVIGPRFARTRWRVDPESRGDTRLLDSGFAREARGRPGMTALCSPWAQNALRRAHNRAIALTIIDRLFSCELP